MATIIKKQINFGCIFTFLEKNIRFLRRPKIFFLAIYTPTIYSIIWWQYFIVNFRLLLAIGHRNTEIRGSILLPIQYLCSHMPVGVI